VPVIGIGDGHPGKESDASQRSHGVPGWTGHLHLACHDMVVPLFDLRSFRHFSCDSASCQRWRSTLLPKFWRLYFWYSFLGHVAIPAIGAMKFQAFAYYTKYMIPYILLGMVNFGATMPLGRKCALADQECNADQANDNIARQQGPAPVVVVSRVNNAAQASAPDHTMEAPPTWQAAAAPPSYDAPPPAYAPSAYEPEAFPPVYVPPAVQHSVNSVPNQAAPAFCGQCGVPRGQGQAFCVSCGIKF
jgi:hypothetical protein